MINGSEGGIPYPLNSKRLKLRHIQHLASALDLPTTATRGDLEVMISGRLVETNHDVTNAQVVITQRKEGEQLSLRDMNRTFLVTRTLPFLVNKSPTPDQEESDFEEEVGNFTAEMTQLQNILQMLEEETIALKIELQSTKERLVELWQENCKQLLDHDTRMAEKLNNFSFSFSFSKITELFLVLVLVLVRFLKYF